MPIVFPTSSEPVRTHKQAVAELTKVGPKGYIHGWIKVGEGPSWTPVPGGREDKPDRKAAYGDVVAAHHAGGVIVGAHNGAVKGKKGIANIGVFDPKAGTVTHYEVPRTSLRVADESETRQAIRRASGRNYDRSVIGP